MTYPQSGQGYGQGQQYGQQYGGTPQAGQPAQYGQQYAQPSQYGQQQYAQGQYNQQQSYTAPKPASQGLPANTGTILAGVIAGLGIIQLFCGFLSVAPSEYTQDGTQIFWFQGVSVTYFAIALAGVLAALTFIVGAGKELVALIAGLNVTAALVVIFQFATAGGDRGAGLIVLLIIAILAALASVLWLLVAAGKVQVAPEAATASAATPAVADSGAHTAVDAAHGYTAADYGQQAEYGHQAADYGQQAATYGQQAAPAAPQYSQAQYGSYGQAAQTAGDSADAATGFNPLPATTVDEGATTTFTTQSDDKGETK